MKPAQSSHEARFWHVAETDESAETVLQCDLCPHHCRLKNGQAGICRSRIHHSGILYAESYGKACSLAIDPIEKKPLLHFYPGSQCLSVAAAGCNLRCKNCQNWEISQASPDEIPYRKILPDELVDIALQGHYPSIAYTYTEPLTWYEYLLDCSKKADQKGIRNIIVSAGYINQEPLKELCPYLDAANIDLKSFSDAVYLKQNGIHLQAVLDTLLTLKENDIWVEVTNLIIPGVNDSPEMIGEMCHWLSENGFAENPLHFSRFFPTYRQRNTEPTPLQTLLTARDIAVKNRLQYVYIGNVGETEGENTFCPQCHQLLIRRHGFSIWENKIKNGVCSFCGAKINGRFTV